MKAFGWILALGLIIGTIVTALVQHATAVEEFNKANADLVTLQEQTAIGKERLARKYKEELRRVVNAVVAIKNLFGELENRKGQPITQAHILGALK